MNFSKKFFCQYRVKISLFYNLKSLKNIFKKILKMDINVDTIKTQLKQNFEALMNNYKSSLTVITLQTH